MTWNISLVKINQNISQGVLPNTPATLLLHLEHLLLFATLKTALYLPNDNSQSKPNVVHMYMDMHQKFQLHSNNKGFAICRTLEGTECSTKICTACIWTANSLGFGKNAETGNYLFEGEKEISLHWQGHNFKPLTFRASPSKFSNGSTVRIFSSQLITF